MYHDKNEDPTRSKQKFRLGSILRHYMGSLRILGEKGIDDLLRESKNVVLDRMRSSVPRVVEWEEIRGNLRLGREVSEGRFAAWPRDTVSNRFPNIDHELLCVSPLRFYGDWHSTKYKMAFEEMHDDNRLKPLLEVTPGVNSQRQVTMSVSNEESHKINVDSSGRCLHASCPTIDKDTLYATDRVKLQLDPGRWITLTQLKEKPDS